MRRIGSYGFRRPEYQGTSRSRLTNKVSITPGRFYADWLATVQKDNWKEEKTSSKRALRNKLGVFFTVDRYIGDSCKFSFQRHKKKLPINNLINSSHWVNFINNPYKLFFGLALGALVSTF